jgi:hypothetical protein
MLLGVSGVEGMGIRGVRLTQRDAVVGIAGEIVEAGRSYHAASEDKDLFCTVRRHGEGGGV